MNTGKVVQKLVNFNGTNVLVTGKVVSENGMADSLGRPSYDVEFSQGGVNFRGYWLIEDCVEIGSNEITKDQRLEKLTQSLENIISLTKTFTPFQRHHPALVDAEAVLKMYGSVR